VSRPVLCCYPLQSELATGGGFVKENDLKKTLDKLVKNAEAIDGVNEVSLRIH